MSSEMPEGHITHINVDERHFRRVLGNHPTGVCVIISGDEMHRPITQIVGTFTSVSIDPPLVAFMPSNASRSWASIRETGKFCVNVLAIEHLDLCQSIFRAEPNEAIAGLNLSMQDGFLRLEGALAWVGCKISQIHDAGDHEIVIGFVEYLEEGSPGYPLLFFKGLYGSFEALPPGRDHA